MFAAINAQKNILELNNHTWEEKIQKIRYIKKKKKSKEEIKKEK